MCGPLAHQWCPFHFDADIAEYAGNVVCRIGPSLFTDKKEGKISKEKGSKFTFNPPPAKT